MNKNFTLEVPTGTILGFGAALAMTISWSEHHSVLMAILHGVCSWLYVAYYMVINSQLMNQ